MDNYDMDKNVEIKFFYDNVRVSIAGPMKDEATYGGRLMIIEEYHGAVIEYHPSYARDQAKSNPEFESLGWEDISTVGFKASHNSSIDAVEIKTVRIPNVIKFDISDLKSYRRKEIPSENKTALIFLLKDGTNVPTLTFLTKELGSFLSALDNYITFKRSKKDLNLFLVSDSHNEEALEKSFSELNLFSEGKSHILSQIVKDPYNTALGGFSKVTNLLYDYMIYGTTNDNQVPCPEESLSSFLHDNILHVDIDNQEEPGYELITCIELPPRPEVKRSDQVSPEEWASFLDSEGRVKDVEKVKMCIFKGGLSHSIRSETWKYLLDYYDYDMTIKEKALRRKQRNENYYRMKLQWKTITADQEARFTALRDRKSLIEKDVSRTDRNHPFFEGDDNVNVQLLQDILMTYCMYNFDLGYVQGMSDLLSPILVVMQNEPDAFWCFAGWLESVGVNFELEQNGMKNQLNDLHKLLHFVDSQLLDYLEKHESGNLYFAFRWLLILFKRDFKFQEIMKFWEILWTGLPCKNFHLLVCIAILDTEKMTIMENDYGLTGILKHVNEMSYKIDLDGTVAKAEAIYQQILNCKYKSDTVNTILGIQPEVVRSPPKTSTPPRPTDIASGSMASGTTLPVNTSSQSDNAVDSLEDYVDLEQHYKLPFDLFS